MLPDPEEPLADQTALAVALGGVICPVPFAMSAAAMRIARPRRSRIASAAFWIGTATIVLQVAGLVALAVVIAG